MVAGQPQYSTGPSLFHLPGPPTTVYKLEHTEALRATQPLLVLQQHLTFLTVRQRQQLSKPTFNCRVTRPEHIKLGPQLFPQLQSLSH